jgi:hypothetical protein
MKLVHTATHAIGIRRLTKGDEMKSVSVCCSCEEECLLVTKDMSPEHSKTEIVSKCCHGFFSWEIVPELEDMELEE